jgi:protein phosphatase-4 regulatory subunit 3
MSADDTAKKYAFTEPNKIGKSTDHISATVAEEQASLSAGVLYSSSESEASKLAENRLLDQEAKEAESRDITEAGEVVKGDIEASGEGAEPSSESFAESVDSAETPEAGEGVLAWSPEDDHEHKRVKVSSYVPFIYLLKFHHHIKFH